MDKPFVINNRFQVDPSLHSFTDTVRQSETRMEARHVKLLCLLSKNEGNLLEREFLVNEIWNNYGGADEALTQGISALRKFLADHQKTLIETIPKKGYIMHATISDLPGSKHDKQAKLSGKKPGYWLVGIMAFIIIALLVFILLPDGQHPASVKQKKDPVDTEEIPVETKEQPDFKNSSPPPGGKDDARK